MALPRYSAPLLPPTHTIPYLTRVLHDHPIDYGVDNEKPSVYISSGGVKLPPSDGKVTAPGGRPALSDTCITHPISRIAVPPPNATKEEIAAYNQGRFLNPIFPPDITAHRLLLHLTLPPESLLEPGVFIVVKEENRSDDHELVLWIRLRVGYDRIVAVFEVGLVDDPRRSGLLFVDIRSVPVTVDMVAHMDTGYATIPSEIWHRGLFCGHSRVTFQRFTTMDGICMRRKIQFVERGGAVDV